MAGILGGLIGSLDYLPVSGAFARYTGDSFSGTTWFDITGNGKHASVNRGTVSRVSSTGNGASKTFNTLQGGVNDGILFPADVLPPTYTLFHVARYNGATRARIVTGVPDSTNWLSGFWGDNTAVAFHSGWLTAQSQRRVFQNNWVISTDQNSLYRGNAFTYGTSGGSASSRLTINNWTGEFSDWQCAEIIVYDRTLSATEYQLVEAYLNSKYGTDIYGAQMPPSPFLLLDAANTSSYPGTGTVWSDVSGNGRHFNMVASAYKSSGPKYMDFNGSFGRAHEQSTYLPGGLTTYCVWTRVKQSTAEWRTLTRALGSGGNHHAIIEAGSYRVGMYDNDSVTAYNDSGFLQTSLPGWNSGQWNLMVWRWQDDRLRYTLSLNGSPNVLVGSSSAATSAYRGNIGAIGAYHGESTNPSVGSQYWGDISQFAVYSRNLTDSEVLGFYNAGRSRHGV
jgi:hypothetical protein